MNHRVVAASLLIIASYLPGISQEARWTEAQAQTWYARQPWRVGSNYIPRTAINQLEMWQADSFDPTVIDQELGWAESLGMNTMRVFLHDLLWLQDSEGFKQRIDRFLQIAERHHIKTFFVLFDSCWDPCPKLGPQRPPIPGVHNSGWVQSPGAAALQDATQQLRLKAYVQGVVGAFAKDERILGWDVWNEPNNANWGSYDHTEVKNKSDVVLPLLAKVFQWVREARPIQPLTSPVWDINVDGPLTPMQKLQFEQSDVISFHHYGWPEEFQKNVAWFKRMNRPVFCSEFMARPVGSTFDNVLPFAKMEKIVAMNWGFVEGKTQTYLPWESWSHPYVTSQPPVWFHEVLRKDGTPYRVAETDLIRRLTGKTK